MRKALIKTEEKKILDEVLNEICKEFNLDKNEVISTKQCDRVVIARHLLGFIALYSCFIGPNAVKSYLGKKQHGTIINGKYVISNLIEVDQVFKSKVKAIENRIQHITKKRKYFKQA